MFYSILHMLVDGVCAYAMFGIFLPRGEGNLLFILYNFCAFALQMPFGVLLDIGHIKLKRKAPFDMPFIVAAAGVICTIFGAVTHPVVLGIGNALFHIGGGVGTIYKDTAKNWHGRGLGIFVAPGALGLYLGTMAGKNGTGEGILWIAAGLMLVMCTAMAFWQIRLNRKQPDIVNKEYGEISYQENRYQGIGYQETGLQQQMLKGAIWMALCCLLVVMLRSYIGMAVTFPWKTTVLGGLFAILAVVLGKMAGGILAARYGLIKISVISLCLAVVCYICSALMPIGIAALFLFNMTMPITLYLLICSFPRMPGFSFGLLTFGLFLGFMPEYFGLRLAVNGNIIGSVGSILSLLILLAGVYVGRRL